MPFLAEKRTLSLVLIDVFLIESVYYPISPKHNNAIDIKSEERSWVELLNC